MFCLIVSWHLLIIFIIQNMVQQESKSSDQIQNQNTSESSAQQKNALSRDFRDENTYSEVILKLASPLLLTTILTE